MGTEVKASLDGTVVRASGHGTYGNVVIIDHTPEIRPGQDSNLLCYAYTLYAHLYRINTGLGKKPRQGEVIGTVGNTGNAKGMKPHLHFETIRSKMRLTWNPQGNTGIEGWPHRMNPLDFLKGFSLPEECFEPLTETEMASFYAEIKTDMRTGPRPALLVDLPDYRKFIKRARGEYPPSGEKPPKVKLTFKNDFSREFHSFFPILDLEVNGRILGRIETGSKIYELDIWS